MRRKPLRPAPERRAPRRQRNRLPARDRPPRRRKVRHQDPPRHPVHRQMMDRPAAAGPARSGPASNHTACSISPAAGDKPRSAASASRRDQRRAAPHRRTPAASTRRRQAAAATEPAGATRSRQCLRTASGDPAAMHRHVEPQPQRVVMIEQRLQRRRQMLFRSPAGTCSSIAWLNRSIGPPRSASQRMIGVAGNAARRDQQRSAAARASAPQPGRAHPAPLPRPPPAPQRSDAGTPPRRQRKPRPPRPAHQLDRHDAVAAKLEEVVVDADPLDAQHLRKQRAQHRLRGVRGAR